MTKALYIRVSTEEQARDGFSIEHQKQRLAAYCVSQGWDDYEFFVDDGYTGTQMERPQLKRLVRRIKAGHIDTVIVYRLDRLSRKQKDTLHLLEDVFESNNVAFKSATEPFDTSTPLGKAMLGILAVFAQLERETIIERVTSGKHERTRQGLWYGGPVPYGYEWNPSDQRLYIVPQQAELVRTAFERFIEGKSMLSIGKWMDKRDKGRLFSHHKTLIYILTNPLYCGKLNQKGLLVDGVHEPIVSYETWMKVQQEMASRKNGRKPYGHYMLSNLMTCGVCGNSLRHIATKDRRFNPPTIRPYYVCSTKRTKNGPACPSKYHDTRKLETEVISRLKQIAFEPEIVKAEIDSQTQPDLTGVQLYDALTSELEGIDEEIERWYDVYGKGKFDRKRVEQKLIALEEQKRGILLQLDDLDIDNTEQNEALLFSALKTIGESWDDLNEEEQASVLRLAVKNITVGLDGDLTFEWNL